MKSTKLGEYLTRVIKFKNYFNLIKKVYKKKYKMKKTYRKKIKFKYNKNFKNILNSLKNKKTKMKELLYFLKYFLVFRKRQSKIFNLSRIKSRLSKRRFFIKKFKFKKFIKYFSRGYRKTNLKQKKHINLINLDLFFNRNRRFYRLHRLYDVRKKCIRYLNNNRGIYKMYKFRVKQNFKFIKRHIRSISSLDIKSRIHMYEFSVRNIAIKLKYAYTYRNAAMFIKSGFLFLNGCQEINPFKFAYKGDTIELTYSKFIMKLKYKIKKKLNISMRKFKRYNWRTLKNKVNYEDRKIRISRFSEKILHYKNKITRIFQFDYRTLSYMIVNDIRFKKDLTYLNKKILPIYLLKLFNWKLIS